jgi:hypothetical protein
MWRISQAISNLGGVQADIYANETHDLLRRELGEGYEETDPTETLMGIQLNHPMWYLEFTVDPSPFQTLSAGGPGGADDGILTGLRMLKIPSRQGEGRCGQRLWHRRSLDRLKSIGMPFSTRSPSILVCQ